MQQHANLNRRDMLRTCATGFGHLALLGMLGRNASAAKDTPTAASPLAHRLPATHHAAKAKRVIFLFMHGGPSHVDTFDYKPKLFEDDGKPLPFNKPRIQFAQTSNLFRPRWDFKPHGACGHMISELFPHTATHADELCLVRSVHGTNEAHGGALLKLHTGSDSLVRPSMGSWITYGLGTESQNLPGFITMGPTLGHGGSGNWSSSFLPASNQGTRIGSTRQPIAESNIPFLEPIQSDAAKQRRQIDLVQAMNRQHMASRPDPILEARIRSFELAYNMQMEAPEVMDLSGESKATKELYGINNPTTDNFARQCLLARRFVERGVRFVQCTQGYWDQHSNLEQEHASLAEKCDQPIAGLLGDLKGRGLLDETLVIWGGEFGRTPTLQGKSGRDHHPHAFTMWMAGGGVRGGMSYGETDEYGFYCVKNKVHVHDLHATILHLLGLDHERLTYAYGGRDFRLTDVYGDVVHDIIS